MKVNHLNLLMKPTEYCNLNCQYCYAKPFKEKYGKAKMTIETFEKAIRLASEHAKSITIIWHGGEPTLMGVDWYYQCNEVLKKFDNIEISQSMQTNGTMLDESWEKLEKDTGIGFGMSFDVFDQEVRTSDMDLIESKLQKIKDFGSNLGVITVINKKNYTKQIEIYEYFKNKFHITPAFNHIFSTTGTRTNDLDISIADSAKEFDKFFNYILHDTSKDSIGERTTEQMFRHVIGSRNKLVCTYCDCTYSWIGISATGDIYPCDFLIEEYYMGNINDVDSIQELFDSPGHKKYCADRRETIGIHCSKCKLYDSCTGGCNTMHMSYTGTNA
jgi:uncharacterized protein